MCLREITGQSFGTESLNQNVLIDDDILTKACSIKPVNPGTVPASANGRGLVFFGMYPMPQPTGAGRMATGIALITGMPVMAS